MFLLTKFRPLGLVSPCPGATCIKSWKFFYKIRLQRDFLKLVANDWSDQRFLLTSKFCLLGLSAPDLWLYTFIKSWKDVYKVRGWRDFFVNLQHMTILMRPTCWHQNFGPNGLSAPAQGLCLNVFSSITADFNISSAIRWAIQDQWSSGTPGIYAKGYIVFAFPFICSFVHASVTFVEFTTKFSTVLC